MIIANWAYDPRSTRALRAGSSARHVPESGSIRSRDEHHANSQPRPTRPSSSPSPGSCRYGGHCGSGRGGRRRGCGQRDHGSLVDPRCEWPPDAAECVDARDWCAVRNATANNRYASGHLKHHSDDTSGGQNTCARSCRIVGSSSPGRSCRIAGSCRTATHHLRRATRRQLERDRRVVSPAGLRCPLRCEQGCGREQSQPHPSRSAHHDRQRHDDCGIAAKRILSGCAAFGDPYNQ